MKYDDGFFSCNIQAVKIEAFCSDLPICIDFYDEEGPAFRATVNIGSFAGNSSIVMKNCGWLDTNNVPGIEMFIQEHGLGEPYTRFGSPVIGHSGFCSYPLYKFDRAKLMELDAEGLERYEAHWEKKYARFAKKAAMLGL